MAGLAPRFMTRIGGLPIESAHALRCPETDSWARTMLDEQDRLRAIAAGLSEPLAAQVGAAADDGLRRKILALRRDVFNGRTPPDVPAALAVAGRLDPGIRESLTGWITGQQRLAELREDGTALLNRELALARTRLREMAGQTRLRAGLLLASPTLDRGLDSYIAAAQDKPDKRGRKMERSLLGYLYRTACKTSPFSTFTSLAPGLLRPGTPGVELGAPGVELSTDWTSHPRLNVAVLTRLSDAIAADRRLRDDLPVTLAAGLALGDGRIRYVRRSLTAGDDALSVSLDSATDRLFYLRHSGALERLIELLRTAGGQLRRGDVTAWIAGSLGAEADEAEEYLNALLMLGLLQLPHLATGVHQPDPLRAYQDALRALDRPWADDMAGRLDGPARWIADYPAADVAGRRDIVGRLRAELMHTADSLPQMLLYEDVTVAPIEADSRGWEPVAAALTGLSAMFPAFDPVLPQVLALKAFFVARYGTGGSCRDLLTMIHEFHEDFLDDYVDATSHKPRYEADGSYRPEVNWLDIPEISAIDAARATLTALIRQDTARLAEDAAEYELPAAAVAAVAAGLGGIGRGFAPQTYFLQLANRPDGPLAVLNNAYGSLGFPFTRFTHCLPDLAVAELREHLRAVQPAGSVFAEITGGAAITNLNLHSRLTDYEIVCPGEHSDAPPSAQLHLAGLCLVHDEVKDRLVLRYNDLEVIPVYFGYLVPQALPEIPRTLTFLAPSFQVNLDVWRGVPARPATGAVTSRPRVRYGRLVLQRRSWQVPTADLPRQRPGISEAEWYLAWRQWQRTHRLPDEVFFTVHDDSVYGDSGGGKPQYADFASPLSLLALDALLTGTARVVIHEMLPATGELTVRSAQGHHVAETVMELL